ncbi:GIY-YIG nuclease family protein [Anaerococcus sp. AGMB09787]|uniref:GIY-YIG nuclease family protein n=1 Tax=Anaerococcus sp. AGMB09787 TaxID=2922869 RepID=UPI001FAF4463|nr:GIY-YIG nuclease family protein [Anaerococcus sp. AGMB09787]
MGHFVYMLRCRDNSLYTGYTTNLDNRVKAHNSGKGAKYTRARRPVKLVFYREVADKSTGLKLEYRIKKLSKAKKEELVKDFIK